MSNEVYGSEHESLRKLDNGALADLLYRVYRDNLYQLTPYESAIVEVAVGRLMVMGSVHHSRFLVAFNSAFAYRIKSKRVISNTFFSFFLYAFLFFFPSVLLIYVIFTSSVTPNFSFCTTIANGNAPFDVFAIPTHNQIGRAHV